MFFLWFPLKRFLGVSSFIAQQSQNYAHMTKYEAYFLVG